MREPAAAAKEVSPAALVEAIGSVFAAQDALLRQLLAQLEAALQSTGESKPEPATERLALVQVGLGCLAEAIDELVAELSDTPRGGGSGGRRNRPHGR